MCHPSNDRAGFSDHQVSGEVRRGLLSAMRDAFKSPVTQEVPGVLGALYQELGTKWVTQLLPHHPSLPDSRYTEVSSGHLSAPSN